MSGMLLLLLSCLGARADKRIALVIGNSAYTPALSTPANDAEDLAGALGRVGFDVVLERNLDKRGMEAAIGRFAQLAQDAETALFFYAGHGLQHRGLNYLVPIDAALEDELKLSSEVTRVEDVLFALQRAKGIKILVLDAGRDNPLLDLLARTASRRDLLPAKGLARIEPTPGMVIAYSTQVDQIAVDGGGRNSPFATALIKEMAEPGLEIGTLFRRVAADVHRATKGRQLPELSMSPAGEFYLNSQIQREQEPQKQAERERLERAQRASQEAERKRLQEQADRERLEKERVAREDAQREQERREREQLARDQEKREEQRERLAREERAREQAQREAAAQTELLTPPTQPASSQSTPGPTRGALVQEIKKELRRVGCYAGRIDGKWGTRSTLSSVKKFSQHAKLAVRPDEPTGEFLDQIRGKSERVCPPECSPRQVEMNGRCVAKTCPDGTILGRSGACETRKEPARMAARLREESRSPALAPGRPRPTAGDELSACWDDLDYCLAMTRRGGMTRSCYAAHERCMRTGNWDIIGYDRYVRFKGGVARRCSSCHGDPRPFD